MTKNLLMLVEVSNPFYLKKKKGKVCVKGKRKTSPNIYV